LLTLIVQPSSIYQLEKTAHQARAGGDSESRPLISSEDPTEVFSRSLGVELEKICSFYVAKEGELLDEVNQLVRDVGERPSLDLPDLRRMSTGDGNRPHVRTQSSTGAGSDDDMDDSASDDDETTGLNKPKSHGGRRRTIANIGQHQADLAASSEFGRSARRHSTVEDFADHSVMFSSGLFSSSIMLKKRIISLYVQLCELKSYAQLNKTGFSKVLKKFDKILDKELKGPFMRTNVDTAYPFKSETKQVIEENIQHMETAYAEVVTGGDRDLAKKDLRSHLREHVVWERNTVWRDLIGIERRGEAARFGQTLLGQDQTAAPKRLQGDDPEAVTRKQFKTPLGRFAVPSWLAGSSMLTLLGSLAAFIALLAIPIMDKPEEQNCLALLVFVSLLWATEVSISP
jgi:hypothetical protein